MSRVPIGRTIRRLRLELSLTQQALASRLGISASYLNLIEHDQRKVTATLLIKLAETPAGRSRHSLGRAGTANRNRPAGDVRGRPAGQRAGAGDRDRGARSALPGAARAVLALYRAWRVASEDASGISRFRPGRRILLPTEEARDALHERTNHFPELEAAAERVGKRTRRRARGDEPRRRGVVAATAWRFRPRGAAAECAAASMIRWCAA